MERAHSDERGLQNAIAELKMFEDYYSELGTREAILIQAVTEARTAQEALNGLPKEGTVEIFSPIGGGVSLPVSYNTNKRLLLNVGANVIIEASREKAIKYLDAKIQELEKAINIIHTQKEELAIRINNLRSQISKIIQRGAGQSVT